jgi:carboxyl-terminal processing protease
MTRTRKALLAGLVVLPVLAASGFALQARNTRGGAQLLDQVLTFVALRYVDTLDAQSLYEKAARGLVKELNDPYTELFSPKQMEEFARNTNGRYAGLGMQITSVAGYVTVDKVFPNTPAESRGVQEGDRIVAVDTFQARGWTTQQAQNKLLGPVGSSVTVTFGRPGVTGPIKLDFKRAEIKVPAVPYAMMIEPTVGYIPLTRFSEQTTQDIAENVLALRKKGAKGIVIDLRGNPGGILEEAFNMSNLFLPKGKELLSVRGRGEFQKFVSNNEPLASDIPLVLLVDGYSASASEIVAGALQDYDRALVLGTTSYGKGLVQSVYNLDGGYALKITTGKWYTPSGRSIQKERKFNADGQFVEVLPDSMETDSARKAKPLFKSLTTGRTLYGGGAITPDVYVSPDTISSAEQKLARLIIPKSNDFFTVISEFAQEEKGKLKPDFVYEPTWRDEIYKRLDAKGVKVERAAYDAGAAWVDRQVENRVARVVFGDTTVKRHELRDDNQLRKAIDLLRKSATQKEVFAAGALMPSTTKPSLAGKSSK